MEILTTVLLILISFIFSLSLIIKGVRGAKKILNQVKDEK